MYNGNVHIIFVQTTLINLFFLDFIRYLDGQIYVIELGSKRQFTKDDSCLEYKFFEYSSFSTKIVSTLKAKKYIDALVLKNSKMQINYYFAHVVEPITNYCYHHKFASLNLIPDGAMNLSDTSKWKRTWLNKFNTFVVTAFSGIYYKFPKRDFYGYMRKYKTLYYIHDNAIYPNIFEKRQKLVMNEKYLSIKKRPCSLILGQVVERKHSDIYYMTLKEIVKRERNLNVGRKILFKPHPKVNVTKKIQEFLAETDLEIYNDTAPVEISCAAFERIISISSSALINISELHPDIECVLYRKNVFDIEEKAFDEWIKAFRQHGCKILEI